MNPFVLRRGDEYWMFYGGGDAERRKRVCLAIAPVDDFTGWKRLGPLFDVGGPGAFDALWCVMPMVHRIAGRWHLYYTGYDGVRAGLPGFRGIGLAVSDDLLNWTKYSAEPILCGDGYGRPGIVGGGGTFQDIEQPGGGILYRMYQTYATGTPSPDLLVDQAKLSVVAHSRDGVSWFDKHVVLGPRAESDYENAATIALNVWRAGAGYRAIYGAIGTRFGAYSICEARSEDGLNWERGAPGENLALTPSAHDGDGQWANRMCEYPNVIEEDGRLRLFYCGNGYGATGIGTAVAEPLGRCGSPASLRR